ncbi:hypothetical protein TWF225_004936 [Orbilia oligospora]|uniref:Mso1 N-terminal domain-containing protein n=1 Tax=Orbilia oligospora TaxID=2813651 RepID=A0A7C8PXC9_ORBOL|nr:hypothetical protein TWF706_003013 [Orbilia oligospora]KAF3182855.1 hypothetical protein TWF751_006049 [Orbilia oligospora]KAF3185962.1 hypothetical protein TWF225_004936 [Orbilia oligospora]KAF3263097.1 hypothetical protein TWF128_002054 [Orbilia oligospora]KAF3294484.1 hypothetical protein TWF132_003456 [Orbilia oligospora]
MSYWSKFTQAASTKVANFKPPSFTVISSDADHAEQEDESAVSRALRSYYKEKDGFVPDWLAPAAVSPMIPQNPQMAAPQRPMVPAQMATGGSPAMLGDIFGDGPKAAPQPLPMRSGMQSAPPAQHQQHQPPPPPPQPQQPQQAPPPQRQPMGLPGGPRGGVKPFMALKREQQQRQHTQTAPPQQHQQPPPPAAAPRQQSYGSVSPQPSGGRAPPPPSGYGNPAGGRRGFAAAAGETGGRSPAPPGQAGGRAPPANDKPFMSATAPWSGGGDDFSGYGGTPGYYGR